MNIKFSNKCFLYIKNKRNIQHGFTLIELLVVVIIIGILSAIALPNFLQQVGKAREVEIKNAVGTINRAQQAYHWEKQVFAQGATDQESLNSLLGVGFDSNYIDTYNIVANATNATIAPTNTQFADDGTRAYAGAIFVTAGTYSSIVCQSPSVADSLAPPTTANTCAGGGNRLQ
ncbi:MAG: type IV pilin-like G/H family protein [Cyanobacteria bacterium J06643_13]